MTTLSVYVNVNLALSCVGGGFALSHPHNGCPQQTHARFGVYKPSLHGCVIAASESCCQIRIGFRQAALLERMHESSLGARSIGAFCQQALQVAALMQSHQDVAAAHKFSLDI